MLARPFTRRVAMSKVYTFAEHCSIARVSKRRRLETERDERGRSEDDLTLKRDPIVLSSSRLDAAIAIRKATNKSPGIDSRGTPLL